MTEKEKMQLELPFYSFGEELTAERKHAQMLMYKYNNLSPAQTEERDRLIRELLGKTGKNILVEQSFKCDYGYNIEVGENFYSNFNLVILDGAKVKIGDNCMIGPNVSIFTAGHPVDPEIRNSYLEYNIGITIGDSCWIGGGTVINPGVCIGNNVVIGSGSVVTKDIPDNVIAAGNPAVIIRPICSDDKKYYFKKRLFPTEK